MNRNLSCADCELGKMRKGRACMPGRGNPHANIMVIGESPRFKDDATDMPFADKQVQALFAKAGLTEKNTFFTYAVKCRTANTGKKGQLRATTRKQRQACHKYLLEEVREVKPKLTIVLGNEVFDKVKRNAKASEHRGQFFPSQLFGQITPTFKPEYIFVNPAYEDLFVGDIKSALQYLQTGRVEVGHEYGSGIIIHSTDEAEIERCFREAVHAGFVGSDVETSGLRYWDRGFQTFCYGACWGPARGINFDSRQFPEQYQKFLRIPQVVHNSSFEGGIWSLLCEKQPTATEDGFPLNKVELRGDTMILGHIRNPFLPVSLQEQSKIYLNARPWKGNEQDEESWFRRNAVDIETTHALYTKHLNYLSSSEKQIHDRIILPCGPIYGRIHSRVLCLSVEGQRELEAELICEREEHREKLIAAGFPRSGNPGSNEQIRDFLYRKLGIPVPANALAEDAKDEYDASTGAEFLAELALDFPVAQVVRDYRHAEKLRTNYLYRHPDGSFRDFIRPNYKITGQVTGRPSSPKSDDPEVYPTQTFSREDRVRRNYIARPGKVFISGDLKQVELVVMARLSGDATMREIYLHGGDIHKTTARAVVGVSGDPTKEQRSKAKACNFSLQYGASVPKFRMLMLKDFKINVSMEEARRLRDGWFEEYAGVARYHKQMLRHILLDPTITCPLGRKWTLGKAKSKDQKQVDAAWREALNYPIQWVGAAMCLLGLQAQDQIAPNTSILTVHDSVVAEVSEQDAEAIAREWKELWERVMMDVYPHEIPITCDMQWGHNLGEFNEKNPGGLRSFKWT